jgi:hypothetical protein
VPGHTHANWNSNTAPLTTTAIGEGGRVLLPGKWRSRAAGPSPVALVLPEAGACLIAAGIIRSYESFEVAVQFTVVAWSHDRANGPAEQEASGIR